ncbi:hypothetical protein TNCT_237031 [Trichonephila clavata]|uniref:Uncharacterized protein n=1 Tax=Trichonephila clavata TaxID=2740835 RepID=A0A8X6HIG7_TRICU|nr:hypothetical protein TNCT_237031 [Trichonephila clavata]
MSSSKTAALTDKERRQVRLRKKRRDWHCEAIGCWLLEVNALKICHGKNFPLSFRAQMVGSKFFETPSDRTFDVSTVLVDWFHFCKQKLNEDRYMKSSK